MHFSNTSYLKLLFLSIKIDRSHTIIKKMYNKCQISDYFTTYLLHNFTSWNIDLMLVSCYLNDIVYIHIDSSYKVKIGWEWLYSTIIVFIVYLYMYVHSCHFNKDISIIIKIWFYHALIRRSYHCVAWIHIYIPHHDMLGTVAVDEVIFVSYWKILKHKVT